MASRAESKRVRFLNLIVHIKTINIKLVVFLLPELESLHIDSWQMSWQKKVLLLAMVDQTNCMELKGRV